MRSGRRGRRRRSRSNEPPRRAAARGAVASNFAKSQAASALHDCSGGDIGAAVGTPGAPGAVRHAGVAHLAAVHERAAEQAGAEAVLRLQTAHTAARLDVGAHLHEGGGLAPELAAGGAAVKADTRGGGRATRRSRLDNGHGLDRHQEAFRPLAAS